MKSMERGHRCSSVLHHSASQGRMMEACKPIYRPKAGEQFTLCDFGPGIQSGDRVLEELEFDSGVQKCFAVLLGWLIGCMLIGYLARRVKFARY